MPSRRVLPGLAALALVTGACAYLTEPIVTPYRPPALVATEGTESGELLYQRDCAWCHGASGEGTDRGPGLQDVGEASTHFYLTSGRMPIQDPEEAIERSPTFYGPDQIDALVAHVATFGEGPPIPEVHPEEGDFGLGLELYELNCAACHAPSGVGGSLAFGPHAPGILESTPVEVAEAMRVGPGNMPVFGPESFGQEELDAIVRYVVFLQELGPAGPGGWAVGRLGPVTEGLAAWALGIVPLLIALGWITRRP